MTPAATNAFRHAFLRACALDVQARKAGNVSLVSSGHRMDAQLFIDSAEAAAGPLCEAGASVGKRIEGAMRATLSVAHCNTNLGILLLCAPLALAFDQQSADEAEWRRRLAAVLRALDIADAGAAYRAIAAAQPGGLGHTTEQDVAAAPTIGLREAMALAADRDRIAWQYTHDFADVFELGLPAFRMALQGEPSGRPERAMQRVFLEFVAGFPDSHIVRKHGAATAHSVMAEALPWLQGARRGVVLDDEPAYAAWDEALKSRGINPGTSADLSVATALVAVLCGTGV